MANSSASNPPALTAQGVQELEERYTSGAYPKRPVAIVRGEGAWLWEAGGERYLDLTSGQGVALLGHCHPHLQDALARQASQLITCPEIFYNDRRAELYQALARQLPEEVGRFFLCNSGAEAVEGAIKLARALTGRPGIVAARNGFHGRTLGALSATWKSEYRQLFDPLLPAFSHIPFNDLEAAQAAIGEDTAAVLLEVVQGEGGVNPADPGFLQAVRQICLSRGALLILDEIQTGLGRTGHWFAFQHEGLIPDVVCLGKGIAGGLPMGVVAWRHELGSLPRGSHGSTFGGNPLVSAAALATLQVLEGEQLPQRSQALGSEFISRLQRLDHPLIRQVRGRGLMIGIDLRRRVTPLLKALMEHQVLALPAGATVLRLLPPLVIDEEQLDLAFEAILECLDSYPDE